MSLTLYQDYTAFRSLDLDQVIKGLNQEISTMPLNTLKDIQAILESLKRYIHDNSILLNMYNSFFKQYDLVANLLAWWNNCFLLLLSLASFLQIRLFWRIKAPLNVLALLSHMKKTNQTLSNSIFERVFLVFIVNNFYFYSKFIII